MITYILSHVLSSHYDVYVPYIWYHYSCPRTLCSVLMYCSPSGTRTVPLVGNYCCIGQPPANRATDLRRCLVGSDSARSAYGSQRNISNCWDALSISHTWSQSGDFFHLLRFCKRFIRIFCILSRRILCALCRLCDALFKWSHDYLVLSSYFSSEWEKICFLQFSDLGEAVTHNHPIQPLYILYKLYVTL